MEGDNEKITSVLSLVLLASVIFSCAGTATASVISSASESSVSSQSSITTISSNDTVSSSSEDISTSSEQIDETSSEDTISSESSGDINSSPEQSSEVSSSGEPVFGEGYYEFPECEEEVTPLSEGESRNFTYRNVPHCDYEFNEDEYTLSSGSAYGNSTNYGNIKKQEQIYSILDHYYRDADSVRLLVSFDFSGWEKCLFDTPSSKNYPFEVKIIRKVYNVNGIEYTSDYYWIEYSFFGKIFAFGKEYIASLYISTEFYIAGSTVMHNYGDMTETPQYEIAEFALNSDDILNNGYYSYSGHFTGLNTQNISFMSTFTYDGDNQKSMNYQSGEFITEGRRGIFTGSLHLYDHLQDGYLAQAEISEEESEWFSGWMYNMVKDRFVIYDFDHYGQKLKDKATSLVLLHEFETKLDNGLVTSYYKATDSQVIKRYEGNEESLTIPSSYEDKTITRINNLAFCNNTSLKNIVIPDSIEEIRSNAFENCENLESVTLPASLKAIRPRVFKNCAKLKDIYFQGSEEDWNNIYLAEEWNSGTGNYTIHYNAE